MNAYSSPYHRRASHSKRGVALVLVLLFLVLIVGLLLSLFSHTKSERLIAASYSDEVKTRVLADTALNIVIGQITDATSDTSQTISWASQPGAIRTYGNTSLSTLPASNTSDNFLKGYKLFSSSQMTTTTESALCTAVGYTAPGPAVDPSWPTKIGQYVNLNQPVTKNSTTIYPIADPAALTSGPVGFSVNNPGGTDTHNYTTDLAMPVEWLYLLQDGTVASGAWQSDGSILVTTASGTHPSTANPIVGRVAFWTDDESSKVNVNTASEGLYWDSPRVDTQNTTGVTVAPSSYVNAGGILSSAFNLWGLTTPPSSSTAPINWNAVGTDQGFAANQPANSEFNRFPGHPATTSLSAVFPELNATQLFALLPRLTLNRQVDSAAGMGGSAMGTISWPSANAYSNTNPTVQIGSNRLYASEGEVMLQPSHSALNSPVTPAMVSQRKFFLTSTSDAPELNLFGRPRVSMWPVYYQNNATAGGTYQTPYDQVTSFCSTIAPSSGSTTYPFYFERENAYSTSTDMAITSNANLFTYLQDVSGRAVPGFGGQFSTKYGSTSERDQILTEMLDYIRCTNLFDPALEPAGSAWTTYNGVGRASSTATPVTTGNEFTSGARYIVYRGYSAGFPGHGQVVPLVNGTSMGLGRTFTVSQVALHIICTADSADGSAKKSNSPTVNPTIPSTPSIGLSSGKEVQAMLEVELSSPMEGYPNLCPCVGVTITGANGFTIKNSAGTVVPLFPPSGTSGTGTTTLLTYSSAATGATRTLASISDAWWSGIGSSGYGGIYPFIATIYSMFTPPNSNAQKDGQTSFSESADTSYTNLTPYYFISAPLLVSGSTMTVGWPSSLKLQLFYPQDDNSPTLHGSGNTYATTTNTYQTITITSFNSTNFGTTLPTPSVPTAIESSTSSMYQAWGFYQNLSTKTTTFPKGRLYYISPGSTAVQNWFQTGDVVRAVEVADGDFRLNAGMASVPASRFTAAIGDSITAPSNIVHSLACPFITAESNNSSIAPAANYTVEMSYPPGREVGSSPTTAASNSTALWGAGTTGVSGIPLDSAPSVPVKGDYQGAVYPYTYGDWDNGIAGQADGPFANMADSGTSFGNEGATEAGTGGTSIMPYFAVPDIDSTALALMFSPNRLVPSPGMFGSLPTGVIRGLPWQTLRFRPQSNTAGADYTPNYSTSIPDYLWMDLFWMPVVQPYAISNPFSTSGKINMNYQILPFSYLDRQTGMYAVLKNERMLSIPSSAATTYKYVTSSQNVHSNDSNNWRHPINVLETLKQFDTRFSNNQIFRTPAELCDMYVVPNDGSATAATMSSYWQNYALTGDNTRERPYTVIYPRLTTQSNTFRVHYWVQLLKKSTATVSQGSFYDPSSTYAGIKDTIRAEQRGNYVIERFLEPTDSRIGTGTGQTNPLTSSLNGLYKIRTLNSTAFNP